VWRKGVESMRVLTALGIFLVVLGTFAVQAAMPVTGKIIDSRWLGGEQGQRQLIFDLSQPVQYRLFNLAADGDKPERVVIDLLNTQLVGNLAVPLRDYLLLNLRSGVRDERDLRIVLDLRQSVGARAYLLKPEGQAGHRLVVALDAPSVSSVPRLPPRNLPVPSISQVQTRPIFIPSVPAAPPLPTVSYRTNPAPSSSGGRDVVIAIDAGHGGLDPGAIGKTTGVYEKTVVLAIARELERRIGQTPGMRPVLTRNNDTFLTLRNRIDRARQYKADVFVSIHADAHPDNRALQGSSVYILSQRGASSEAAKWLAEKENAADLVGGVRLSDKDDLLASVLLDLSQAGTLESSGQLAQQVLGSLRGIGPVLHGQIQQAAFMVLRSPDIPSILVETAFLSNPQEEQKLKQPGYQKKLADAIFNGIQAYLKQRAPPGTAIAGRNGLLARQ